jgi:hypothetical protein
MLTIKVVYGVNQEQVFEAKRVRTSPIEADTDKACVNVYFQEPDGIHEMVICSNDCAIYVMNDKGRTIANY